MLPYKTKTDRQTEMSQRKAH